MIKRVSTVVTRHPRHTEQLLAHLPSNRSHSNCAHRAHIPRAFPQHGSISRQGQEELLQLSGRHCSSLSFLKALTHSRGDYLEARAVKSLGHRCKWGHHCGAGSACFDHGDHAVELATSSSKARNNLVIEFRIQVHDSSVSHTTPGMPKSQITRRSPQATCGSGWVKRARRVVCAYGRHMHEPGRIALVGSGEYLPAMAEIESWLLQDQPPRFVQLATAAAPEGQRSLDHWHELGAQAAVRAGVDQVIVDVRTRHDADDLTWVQAINGAGLIYLSGGNPAYLAKTLRGTAVWQAIKEQWLMGASVAGCSAGAMALCGYVPDFRHPRSGGTDGLGLIPDLRVLPHFDRYTKWIPDFALRPLVSAGTQVVGIDEQTALVSQPPTSGATWQFRARGIGSAYRVEADRRYRINGTLDVRVPGV